MWQFLRGGFWVVLDILNGEPLHSLFSDFFFSWLRVGQAPGHTQPVLDGKASCWSWVGSQPCSNNGCVDTSAPACVSSPSPLGPLLHRPPNPLAEASPRGKGHLSPFTTWWTEAQKPRSHSGLGPPLFYLEPMAPPFPRSGVVGAKTGSHASTRTHSRGQAPAAQGLLGHTASCNLFLLEGSRARSGMGNALSV